MGGDPAAIGATPDGDWQQVGYGTHGKGGAGDADGERRIRFDGKVASLIYDRFGDFAGFVLDTEDGERRFESIEAPMERVVLRAFAHRIRITIVVERDDVERPETIYLHGPYYDAD
jgi:hypothetical protein